MLEELAAQDSNYETNTKRSMLLREAQMTRYEGKLDQAQTGAQGALDTSYAGFKASAAQAAARLNMRAAKNQYSSDLFSARMGLKSGQSDASGARLASYGTLLTGAAGAASSASQINFGGGGGTTVRRAVPTGRVYRAS
jgi:hypothetical protein